MPVGSMIILPHSVSILALDVGASRNLQTLLVNRDRIEGAEGGILTHAKPVQEALARTARLNFASIHVQFIAERFKGMVLVW
jgi:hypothetical protein